MEPESVGTKEALVPEQRDESPDPRPVAAQVLIPTPTAAEPGRPETGPDGAHGAAGGTVSETGSVTRSDAEPRHGSATLSARDRAVLDFEKRSWPSTGAKEQAIRERFDLSATLYFQALNALLDRPEALAADPVLVNRLRRRRDARRQSRSAHRADTA